MQEKTTRFLIICHNDLILQEALISIIVLTIVLMPWENGRSWINPGTKFRVKRAEQNSVEWAGMERGRKHNGARYTHYRKPWKLWCIKSQMCTENAQGSHKYFIQYLNRLNSYTQKKMQCFLAQIYTELQQSRKNILQNGSISNDEVYFCMAAVPFRDD